MELTAAEWEAWFTAQSRYRQQIILAMLRQMIGLGFKLKDAALIIHAHMPAEKLCPICNENCGYYNKPLGCGK